MLNSKQIEAAREAFYAAGWGQNEVMWKCWQQGMAFAIQSHMDALEKHPTHFAGEGPWTKKDIEAIITISVAAALEYGDLSKIAAKRGLVLCRAEPVCWIEPRMIAGMGPDGAQMADLRDEPTTRNTMPLYAAATEGDSSADRD